MQRYGPCALGFRNRFYQAISRHDASKAARQRQVGIDRHEQTGKPVEGGRAVMKDAGEIIRPQPLAVEPLLRPGKMLVQQGRAQSPARLPQMRPRIGHPMTQAIAKLSRQLIKPLTLRSQ